MKRETESVQNSGRSQVVTVDMNTRVLRRRSVRSDMALYRHKWLSLIIFFYFINGGMAVALFSCDFEGNDLHGLIQETTDDFDWVIRKGETPTENTGPKGDHTTVNGTGFYAYIEGSNKGIGAMARLITPQIRKTSNTLCLKFFYHMYGDHLGTLNVYVQITDNHRNTSERLDWSLFGEQDERWSRGQVEIDLNDEVEDVRIIFEGIRGSNFRSDIGIDDILLTDKLCQEKYQVTPPYNRDMIITDQLEITTSKNESIKTNSTASVTSEFSGTHGITMTTLFIIVCCGVTFWTILFIVLGVYILRHKPPTLEEMRQKYENNQISELQNNLNESETVRETIINHAAADLHNDDETVYQIELPVSETQIDVGCCDYTDAGDPEHSSDDNEETVTRTPEDDNVFKELLQKFQKMDTSKIL
ncbi:uncharacterized protein LOC144443322 [Glandiceps talaboti]